MAEQRSGPNWQAITGVTIAVSVLLFIVSFFGLIGLSCLVPLAIDLLS